MPIPSLTQPPLAPESTHLLEQWSAWRGERLLPRRSDIDLASIKKYLSGVSLVEVRGPEQVIFKVAGGGFRDYLGFELTGRNYLDLVDPARRAEIALGVQLVIGKPCGIFYVTPHRFPSGAIVPVEVMSLPIEADRPGGPRLILSSNEPLIRRQEDVRVAQEQPLAHPTSYNFIDIGAGLPALQNAA